MPSNVQGSRRAPACLRADRIQCKVNATLVCGVNFAECGKSQKDVPIQYSRLRARAKFFSWLAVANLVLNAFKTVYDKDGVNIYYPVELRTIFYDDL